ncbi:MAG: helix-turn-helix domain-containing protein [Candidatus Pacearchaeota archaeon]
MEETKIYELKYIVLPDFIYKLDLTGIELKLVGFIYSFSGKNFYFSNKQLAEMFNCSEKSITRAMLKIEKLELIEIKYKIKSGGGKIRFIEKKLLFRTDKNVPSEGTKMSLQKGQECPFYIKDNKIKDNKINNSIREETSSSTSSSLKEEKNKTKNKETAELDDTAKTKKEKNSASPIVHDVFSFFRERCKEEFNIVPAIDYGKDGKIIKTRLKVLEVNGVSYKDLINFYLNSTDKDRLGLSLSVCFSNVIVNKFLNEVAFERHIKNIKYTKGR